MTPPGKQFNMKKTMKTKNAFIALCLALGLAVYSLPALAQDTGEPDKAAIEKSFPAKRPYSPYADTAVLINQFLSRFARFCLKCKEAKIRPRFFVGVNR